MQQKLIDVLTETEQAKLGLGRKTGTEFPRILLNMLFFSPFADILWGRPPPNPRFKTLPRL